MALTSSPCFRLPPPAFRPSRQRRFFLSVKAVAAVERGEKLKKESGVALVWFKNDLRTDDHPGLVAASQYRTVVPLYVFDPRILSQLPDVMLEMVLFALKDLKKSLSRQGSDLLVGFGRAENVIRELVQEVKATHLFAEEEVEYNLQSIVNIVRETFQKAHFSWGHPQLVFWRTPLYDIKNLMELPSSYSEFQKLKVPSTVPLECPKLSQLDMALHRGVLPTIGELKKYVIENSSKVYEPWMAYKSKSTRTLLMKKPSGRIAQPIDSVAGSSPPSEKMNPRKRPDNSVFLRSDENVVAGGTEAVLNGLAAYLRYLEGTAKDDWQEVHEKVRETESRRGASFGALFGAALQLGIISRRRVFYEAIKYEKERNAGFLSPFGYSAPTVAAAAESVISMEWYWLISFKSQIFNEAKYTIRVWKWRGYLVQYTTLGDEGPAILLIHGFGAFLEHFRDNLSSIADGGHRVWGITLLGFGKSEKPNIVYTELMWAELLRDFITDVIGEPVHLVGNSIGGYFTSIVAGLWPTLVKTLVLVNSAGSVISEFSSIQLSEARQTSGAAWLGSQVLLLYLRLRAKSILKSYYPTNSSRVDDWLVDEMLRASYDPGAAIVLESVFNLNLSIPLNYLLEAFGGKVLVIQGMKDPLINSKLKISMLKEHCSGITIKELDAGHCPHDETPEEVNAIIQEWILVAEKSLRSCQGV